MLSLFATLGSKRYEPNQLSMDLYPTKWNWWISQKMLKNFHTDTWIKYLMIRKLFVTWHLVPTVINNGNLPQQTPWFGLHYIGSIPCLDTLVLATCTQHCRLDITIRILAYMLNILHVTNVNMPSPLATATVFSLIRILLVLLGRKLQMILLVHGQCQHYMLSWNHLLSLVLTPLLILSRFHVSSRDQTSILLPILSTPGFTLDQCKLSMTMGESL